METFLRWWIISLIIKLGLAAWLPFFSDEAYYWVWSHHLQWSYFDHPPMVAWFFRLGHLFENLGQASRWPAIIIGHCSIFFWHKLLEKHLDSTALKWWWWLVLLNPLLGPGSLVVTPDVPLMFFWSASLWLTSELVARPAPRKYFFLGSLLGMGFCSKYHMALFVVFALISFGKPLLRVLRNPLGLFLLVGAGLTFSFPVWFWNYQNDWASFRFQLQHGLGGDSWRPEWTLSYLGSQMGLLFPTVLFLVYQARKSSLPIWLLRFAWLPMVFFAATSFKGRVEANWPLVAFPAVLAVAATQAQRFSKITKFTLGAWAVGVIVAISLVQVNWLPLEPGRLKTQEHRTYEVLLPVARSYQPFFASSYQMASFLSYRLRQDYFKLQGIGRKDYYDFLGSSRPTTDQFYVALDRWDKIPSAYDNYSVANEIAIDERFRLLELRKK